MKLYHWAWGPYPRRPIIYVTEKGITDIEIEAVETEGVAKGWPAFVRELNPAGTVPILVGDDGTVVSHSLAIIEYLEELYPEPNMLGETPAERARTRELVGIADEALGWFGLWANKGSRVAAEIGHQPNPEASKFGFDLYTRRLGVIEELIGDGPWLNGERITTADCVTMAMFQFTSEFYGVGTPKSTPKLSAWFERFSERPSVQPMGISDEMLELSFGLEEQTGHFV